jgi:cytochrome b
VWDLPTRLFHWVLVACVVGLFITGYTGGNALEWHFRFGYTVFTLVLFRLVWGVAGGRWSRFTSFVHGPGTVLRYLRGQASEAEHLDVGHNPLGAFSVLALLAVLAAQVATGLVADDEIATVGPLNVLVSGAVASQATSYHKDIGQWLMVTLVALHLAAIVFYKVARHKALVPPMIHGDKALPPGVPAAADGWPQRALAAVVVSLAAAVVAWVLSFGS